MAGTHAASPAECGQEEHCPDWPQLACRIFNRSNTAVSFCWKQFATLEDEYDAATLRVTAVARQASGFAGPPALQTTSEMASDDAGAQCRLLTHSYAAKRSAPVQHLLSSTS